MYQYKDEFNSCNGLNSCPPDVAVPQCPSVPARMAKMGVQQHLADTPLATPERNGQTAVDATSR